MDELLYEVRDSVGLITLNRPQARNALTFAMYERLAEICSGVDGAGAVKVLVLRGAGDKAFAAGTDIAQFRTFSTPEDALGYEERIERVLGIVERCRVPTIAAVAGACTGGGAAIASVCDIRIAADNATFGFPIARTLGNCLSLANYTRLVSLLGLPRVKEMIFSARLLSAGEACAAGFVSEVVPVPDLDARAFALAMQIAGHAPLTLRATKEALLRIQERMRPEGGEDLILSCYMSEDFKEGIDAFFSKRRPNWQGR